MNSTIKSWSYGLASAVIGGAANTIAAVIVAPETFNLNAGLNKLVSMAGIGAVLAAANYLKQSPLPASETTSTITVSSSTTSPVEPAQKPNA